MNVNAQKVKNMLSREVLSKLEDNSVKAIIDNIIFDDRTTIDWNVAYEVILAFMPDLQKYEGYSPENMV